MPHPKIRKPKIAALICQRIAEGFTLRQIAKELNCSDSAIVKWRLESVEFGAQYARAKEAQADRFADEILAISDEGSNDWMEREGITVPDHEHINRSRLRVDTRKWLMSKMAPKRYGERLDVAHSGPDGGPIEFAAVLTNARARRLAALETPTLEIEAERNEAAE